MNAEFQRIARRDKKAFLSDQCKEIEEDNRMGKTRDLFKKVREQKGYRSKGLDLIDRVPDELWMEVRDIIQGTGIKTIPKKKKCKKAKWLSEEALQIAVKKTRSEKQRRKGKIYPFGCSSK